jgi:hypothetical protein
MGRVAQASLAAVGLLTQATLGPAAFASGRCQGVDILPDLGVHRRHLSNKNPAFAGLL